MAARKTLHSPLEGIRDKAKKIAAHPLEVSEDGLIPNLTFPFGCTSAWSTTSSIRKRHPPVAGDLQAPCALAVTRQNVRFPDGKARALAPLGQGGEETVGGQHANSFLYEVAVALEGDLVNPGDRQPISEVDQARIDPALPQLGIDGEPRPAADGDQEVHLAAISVSQVVQRHRVTLVVLEEVTELQEVKGN